MNKLTKPQWMIILNLKERNLLNLSDADLNRIYFSEQLKLKDLKRIREAIQRAESEGKSNG